MTMTLHGTSCNMHRTHFDVALGTNLILGALSPCMFVLLNVSPCICSSCSMSSPVSVRPAQYLSLCLFVMLNIFPYICLSSNVFPYICLLRSMSLFLYLFILLSCFCHFVQSHLSRCQFNLMPDNMLQEV